MSGFQLRAGLITGRDHQIFGQNCQDALSVRELGIADRKYLVGVVSDGNGEGGRSEVGARLLVEFVVSEVSLLVSGGVEIPKIPQTLFPRCIGFLRSVVANLFFGSASQFAQFVKDHLLCTLLVFVVGPKNGVIFWAGDGSFYLDGEITVIEQANKPFYLGYHLVDRRFWAGSVGQLPQAFEVVGFEAEEFQQLAIATDGFETNLYDQIWGHKYPRGLQRN